MKESRRNIELKLWILVSLSCLRKGSSKSKKIPKCCKTKVYHSSTLKLVPLSYIFIAYYVCPLIRQLFGPYLTFFPATHKPQKKNSLFKELSVIYSYSTLNFCKTVPAEFAGLLHPQVYCTHMQDNVCSLGLEITRC